jgi:ABC-type transport system involved in cytochrome c biogenesis permease component
VLPLLLPVLVFTTSCAGELAANGWTDRAGLLVLVLALFDVVFTTAALLLAPHVLEN